MVYGESVTTDRRLRLSVVLAVLVAALAAVGSAGAATDTGSLYWTGSPSANVISRAAIANPGQPSALVSTGSLANGVFATSSTMYWASATSGAIGSWPLAGGTANPGFIAGATTPQAVVVSGQYVYWADTTYIGRALLNGQPAQTGYVWYQTPGTSATSPNTAIWADANFVYFADQNSIGRVSLDLSVQQPTFINNASQSVVTSPVALVSDAQYLYWANAASPYVSRASLSTGGAVTPQFVNAGTVIAGLTETGNGTATGANLYWTGANGTIGQANYGGAVTSASFVSGLGSPGSLASTRYALTVGKAGTGQGTVNAATLLSTPNISCGTSCASDYPDMAVVTLTAAATTGSTFTGWTGACTGTAATCTVTMSQAQGVTATFNLIPTSFTLTFTRKGTGAGSIVSSPTGINCGAVCAAPFVKNSKVTLTAVEGPQSDFAGWSGACSGFKQQSTCTVTMSQARAASATFNPAPVLALTKFSLAQTTFRVGSHTTAVRTYRYIPFGTTIKYTLSESADVTVAFQRPGYAKKQYLYRASGAKGGKAGANAIAFTGRVGRTPLGAGRWRVTITASDGRTKTKAQTLYFTVAK